MGNQMFLALGSLILFSTVVLTVHGSLADHSEILMESVMAEGALRVAEGFLEQAQGKSFDEEVLESAATDSSDFTPTISLGKDGTEKYPAFDDIDDFNGYTATVNYGEGAYDVAVSVDYVSPSNPDVVVNTQTYLKRMSVTVTNSYLAGPVVLSALFGYYAQ